LDTLGAYLWRATGKFVRARRICRIESSAETLTFRTVPCLQKDELFPRFDALSDHALLKICAHINYGPNDGRVIRIARDLANKGLINLQHVNRKLLQQTRSQALQDELTEATHRPAPLLP
jgi:hypothetical protein